MRDWQDAKTNCIKLGGHLASIHSATENIIIHEALRKYEANIYIGLYWLKSGIACSVHPKDLKCGSIWSWWKGDDNEPERCPELTPDVPRVEETHVLRHFADRIFLSNKIFHFYRWWAEPTCDLFNVSLHVFNWCRLLNQIHCSTDLPLASSR